MWWALEGTRSYSLHQQCYADWVYMNAVWTSVVLVLSCLVLLDVLLTASQQEPVNKEKNKLLFRERLKHMSIYVLFTWA